MTTTMPTIEINFKKSAETAVRRSTRGIVCLILADGEATSVGSEYIEKVEKMSKKDYAAEEVEIIQSVFLGNPKGVWVLKGVVDDCLELAKDKDFNWLSGQSDSHAKIVTFVKKFNSESKTRKIKAVVCGQTKVDDMHIVNFANTAITMKDDKSTLTAAEYAPRLAGLLAGLPMTESSTYQILNDLKSVVEPEDLDAALTAGNYVLFNDEGAVRVARGINSKTTISDAESEEVKKITVVEAMDLIFADIAKQFRNNFCGKYKNSADNQALFVSAVNSYFRELQAEGVLDNEFDNHAMIDVETQRAALIEIGKDARDWSDSDVKKNTVRSNIYLAGQIRILDSIEDFKFGITMN